MRIALSLSAAVLLATTVSAQPPRGPGMGRGAGGLAMLLANKSVQEEIKLTDEQKEKVATFSKESQAAMMEAFGKLRDLGQDERREAMTKLTKEATEKAEKFMKDTLKEDQVKRIKEINLQQQGVRAFTSEEVQTALKLKDDQKEKLKEIGDQLRKDTMELFQGGGGGRPDPAVQKKVQALGKEALEKALEVLDADQKKAFTEMTGKPFEVKFEAGPGGPGRRPGGGNNPPKKDG